MKMHWHWQNLNERHRSKGSRETPVGLPIDGRASFYLDGEERLAGSVRVEWHLLSKRFGLGVDVSAYDEDHVLLHFGVPPVDLYFAASHDVLRKFFERLVSQPSDMGDTYSGRTVSVSIHDWALWWSFWIDDGGWTRTRPRWRQGSFYPLDALLGEKKNSDRLIERREIVVAMPEGYYKGVCELKEGTWKRARWPFPLRVVRAHIDMIDPIPIPGKGENSWDCDEDAIHGSTFPSATIAEAVGHITGSALRTRERHGGLDWRPEKKKKTA